MAGAEAWKPKFNPWLIAVVVAMAAFMEVLDTSIANIALPHLAGDLGASNDESTWVLTSYLVSNAVVLPMTGWLATTFGRKRLFLLCISLFTITSLLCGVAPSLSMLVLFRVIQGAGGGGLQPMAQAILADTFPPEKRGLAFALYGITTIMAPTIGPTLGGWLTDNYSWRWIFYINLPVGLLTLFLVFRMVDDPPYLSARRGAGVRVDYIGIALLTLAVGALQILLDKGQEEDWFSSRMIITLMVISGGTIAWFLVNEWKHSNPILDIHLLQKIIYIKRRGEQAGDGASGEVGVILEKLHLALERLDQNGERRTLLRVHQLGFSCHWPPVPSLRLRKRNVARSEASRSGCAKRISLRSWRAPIKCAIPCHPRATDKAQRCRGKLFSAN